MDLAALALTFGAIFLVELPDKTFLATLVLATQVPPAPGLARRRRGVRRADDGRGAARPRGVVPSRGLVVRVVALRLFLTGAVILSARAAATSRTPREEYAEARARHVTGFRAVLASFLVLSPPSGATCPSC